MQACLFALELRFGLDFFFTAGIAVAILISFFPIFVVCTKRQFLKANLKKSNMSLLRKVKVNLQTANLKLSFLPIA